MTFVIDFVIESPAIYLSKSNRRDSNTYLSSYHIRPVYVYIPRIRSITTDNHYVSLHILQDLSSIAIALCQPNYILYIYFSIIINIHITSSNMIKFLIFLLRLLSRFIHHLNYRKCIVRMKTIYENSCSKN